MNDAAFFDAAIRRIYRSMMVVSASGAVAAGLMKGWPGGLGFLLGAAGSVLSFLWLKHLVEAVSGKATPRRARLIFLALRYLIFGAAGYVIVRFFEVNPAAILAGLLVSAAAAVGEILYELICPNMKS